MLVREVTQGDRTEQRAQMPFGSASVGSTGRAFDTQGDVTKPEVESVVKSINVTRFT